MNNKTSEIKIIAFVMRTCMTPNVRIHNTRDQQEKDFEAVSERKGKLCVSRYSVDDCIVLLLVLLSNKYKKCWVYSHTWLLGYGS